MVKRLTRQERELIEELNKQGFTAVEIAKEITRQLELEKPRDPRTIKHYLESLPPKRSSELEKQLEWRAHRKSINNLIKDLENVLKFPSPVHLWISNDPKTGEVVTKVGLSLR